MTTSLTFVNGRWRRSRLIAAAGLAVLLAGRGLAAANSLGISGNSGKQRGNCTDCHGGGAQPEVRFVGPTTVAPGAMATFRFEVVSAAPSQRAAGFNVASSQGDLAIETAQGGRRLPNNELTHNSPKQNSEGVAGWEFTWTAPTEIGTYTLFGAGNSVNFNGQQTGDRSNKTTLEVLVDEIDTPTPTPTATPPPATPTITPTRAPVPCVGDCDDSGVIAINELITAVNIAVGNLELSSCSDIDANDSGSVEINELISAVNATLGGCE
jgi:hypothetical protein